mmetsp:Transcript_94174/g.243255  ORF Transcript_94174/g.243255 Transcript_94174/m.243255 type:complete len:315 (+) Transcript_94174:246-1190(+)
MLSMLCFRWPESTGLGTAAGTQAPEDVKRETTWGAADAVDWLSEAGGSKEPEPPQLGRGGSYEALPPPRSETLPALLGEHAREALSLCRVLTWPFRSLSSPKMRSMSCRASGAASLKSLCVSALEFSTRAASGKISQAAWRTAASAASMREASGANSCARQRISASRRRSSDSGAACSSSDFRASTRATEDALRDSRPSFCTSDSTRRMASALRADSAPSACTVVASADRSCCTSKARSGTPAPGDASSPVPLAAEDGTHCCTRRRKSSTTILTSTSSAERALRSPARLSTMRCSSAFSMPCTWSVTLVARSSA